MQMPHPIEAHLLLPHVVVIMANQFIVITPHHTELKCIIRSIQHQVETFYIKSHGLLVMLGPYVRSLVRHSVHPLVRRSKRTTAMARMIRSISQFWRVLLSLRVNAPRDIIRTMLRRS